MAGGGSKSKGRTCRTADEGAPLLVILAQALNRLTSVSPCSRRWS